MLNLANFITLLRIALTPIIVVLMLQGSWFFAVFIFLCAGLTDLLDGFVARRWNQHSKLGQILDPIADKILLGSVMGCMLYLFTLRSHGLLFFGLWFLLLKEMVLLFGGAILWFKYKKMIPPSTLSRRVSLYEGIFLALVMIEELEVLPTIFMPTFWMVNMMIICIILSCRLLWRYAKIL